MSEPSAEVIALADSRLAARAAKDWATSDSLRDEIATLGWIVADAAG
jgi:cysteinyl-tRNA synthetase